MRKLLFTIFIVASFFASAQVVQGIRAEIRDSVTSLTNNTDLVLKGKGTGLVNIEGAYTLPGSDGTSGYLISTDGSGVWGYTDPASITPSGAALTKTDDTNVTLTLGGTPSTALLQATSLTLGWTGNLSVARGGTGASTLTGVLIGNGTSAITGVTTSAGISGAISDETGSGALVFGTSPTIGGSPSASGATWSNIGTITTGDWNGGTIDGTVIGGTTAAAGSFTTVSSSGIGEFSGYSSYTSNWTDFSGFYENASGYALSVVNEGGAALRLHRESASGIVTAFSGLSGIIFQVNADGTLTSGAITSTPLAGTGDDLTYANSSGQIIRSTIDIADVSSTTSSTFTPALEGSASNPSAVTYTGQSGRYIKTGSHVTVFVGLSTTSITGASGSIRISNLPFTIDNRSIGSCEYSGFTYNANTRDVAIRGDAGNTYVTISLSRTGGSGVFSMNYSDITDSNTIQLNFTLTYYTTE